MAIQKIAVHCGPAGQRHEGLKFLLVRVPTGLGGLIGFARLFYRARDFGPLEIRAGRTVALSSERDFCS